jgi:glycosyltransferase involved in cell wall biosynthesis
MMAACDGDLPDNLHFAGPWESTLAVLPRFACFYMVSRDQGCPNASLEAMACALPVVANPDGGTGEQVAHGKSGLLVPDPGGSDAAYAEKLADALAEILRTPSAGRPWVRQDAKSSASSSQCRGWQASTPPPCFTSYTDRSDRHDRVPRPDFRHPPQDTGTENPPHGT